MPYSRKKGFFVCFALGTIILLQLFLPHPETAEASYSRLAGSDRYQTAVAISQKGWKKADYAVLVKADEYADALCAGPLAKKFDAPILFTEKYALNSYTQKELLRLGVSKVIVVGGYGAISGYLEQGLNVIGISSIERIYGADRYETSVEIAKRLGSKQVALATGNNYADALSISAIAAAKDFSILLTQPDQLPEAVKAHLNNYKIERTYLIGGTGAIGQNIESQVPSPVRISGKDRYETNALVLQEFAADIDFNKIYIATGEGKDGYADSLAGVVLAAKTNSPIILNGKTVSDSTRNFIQEKMTVASFLVALGGENAVSYNVLAAYNDIQSKVRKSVFTQKGTYGPSAGTTTIAGSLAIESPDVIVRNTVIEGDLLLGENIGSGTVQLNNVTVKGRTTVRGGGSSSIIGNVFASGTMVIDEPSGRTAAVSLKGKSKVSSLQIITDAILDDSENTSEGFLNIDLIQAENMTLKGAFNSVNVRIKGALVYLQTATIKILNARAGHTVYGSGTISTANIYSNGVVIHFAPEATVIDKGYTAYIAGAVLTEGTTKAADIGTSKISDLLATPGNGQAAFTFSAPTEATKVILKQSTNGGTTWTDATTTPTVLSAVSTKATVTGLVNGMTYLFKLVVTGGTRAGESNVASAKPDGAPISDLAGILGSGQADFSFQAATGAEYVILEQSPNGSSGWVNANAPILGNSATSVTATGLTNGQNYYFRLFVSGGNYAGYSNVVIIGPIKNLDAEPGDQKADLTFSAPTGATSVTILQLADDGITWVDVNAAVSSVLNEKSVSATVTGLTNGQTYQFKLVVVGGARAGESNVASVSLP